MSDEVITRKLIADGNGSNEDRRLLNLFTYIHALQQNPNDLAAMMKVKVALNQAELTFEKHLIVAETCQKGATQTREFMGEIAVLYNEINKLRRRIEQVKEELVDAKLVRKNRQDYDSLAKLINAKPSRAESTALLAKIDQEIKELHEQQKELEAKLCEKRKSMYALAVLLSELDSNEGSDQILHSSDQQIEDGEDYESDTEQKMT